MTLIDTHTHLDHVEHVEQVLEEAYKAGVTGVVTVGVDLASNRRNLEIQRVTTNPKIYVALGIHPGNINLEEMEETLEFIRNHIHKAIAIGEIGLDYWYKWVRKDDTKKKEQRDIFQKQLALSKEFNLPVVIHSRGAWRDCLTMTKDMAIRKALFHWYSGPVEILEEIVAAGYYVSASPSLAYSPQSREAIAHAPLERIFIETDSPTFFSSDGKNGFQATPKDVFRTVQAYCELTNVEATIAAKHFDANARSFFNMKDE